MTGFDGCFQVAHACLGLYREMRITGEKEDALNEWDYFG